MADNITETGGPAFPSQSAPGMTLRDWFAGQALAGICADPASASSGAGELARASYNLADAMLRAR